MASTLYGTLITERAIACNCLRPIGEGVCQTADQCLEKQAASRFQATGWVCPKCGTALAPSVTKCDCGAAA